MAHIKHGYLGLVEINKRGWLVAVSPLLRQHEFFGLAYETTSGVISWNHQVLVFIFILRVLKKFRF